MLEEGETRPELRGDFPRRVVELDKGAGGAGVGDDLGVVEAGEEGGVEGVGLDGGIGHGGIAGLEPGEEGIEAGAEAHLPDTQAAGGGEEGF